MLAFINIKLAVMTTFDCISNFDWFDCWNLRHSRNTTRKSRSLWQWMERCHTIKPNMHKVFLIKCEYKRSIRGLFNPKVGVKAIARTFASGKTEKLVYQVISHDDSKTLRQIKILDSNNCCRHLLTVGSQMEKVILSNTLPSPLRWSFIHGRTRL